MKPTLSEIKNIIEQLAEKVNAPKQLLPTYGHPIDEGATRIEIDSNGQIYYFANDRSRDRLFLRDIDELLYYVFNEVTMEMATKYELLKRVVNQDTRRIWFVEQERLLGVLDEMWKIRKIKEHQQILQSYPFNDKF